MTLLGTGPVIGAAIAPYIQDSSALKHSNAQIPALPSGFPTKLKSELAWTRADFPSESSYIYKLTGPDLDEISKALGHFKCKCWPHAGSECRCPPNGLLTFTRPAVLELDGDLVNCENFPLPLLGPKLDDLGREVHHGKGFCLVRGIDPGIYSVEDLMIVYLGVQVHIADQRGRQDRRGNMLGRSSYRTGR